MLKLFYISFIILSIGCDNPNHNTIEIQEGFQRDFVYSALKRTEYNITYNGSYFNIDYPNGDIPSNYGVCTDVVIRAYRAVGVDLQELIHEDIKKHFRFYPISKHWPNQKKPDTNIDHRRVPNLEYFFSEHGESFSISNVNRDYKPGDIVTWNLMGSSPWHIGIVSNKISSKTNNTLIIHNIGRGPIVDDVLFKYPIRGHYRYIPL